MDQQNRKAYISYSRRSDYSFIRALIKTPDNGIELQSLVVSDKSTGIETLSDNCPANMDLDQWGVLFDENALEPGGSISAFMEELSEAEKIIILLSPGYFQSRFCLTELLHIYHKRAHELLPVVVFIEGYGPGDVKLSELQLYWRQQQGNPAARQCYAQFVEELPLALAWLLGIYDEALESWDELFHLVEKVENGSACRVIEALSREYTPRFQHKSGKQREQLIATEIEKIFANRDLKICFDSLVQRDDLLTDTRKPFAQPLTTPCNVQLLKSRLNTLIDWLESIANENDPSHRLLRLAGQVKMLLGWLLMAAVDDRQLHILIHSLNRQQATAELPLYEENETSFQMVVAAVAHTSVRFFYNPAQEPALTGEGKLVLNEKGMDVKNYSRSFKCEDAWFNQYGTLFKQMSESQHPELNSTEKHKTAASLDGAIEAILERRSDFYLLFDRNFLDISPVRDFRTDLGKKYPMIQQVVSETSPQNGAQQYYLDGLNSGYLDQKIRNVYSLIYRITHGQTDNA